MESTQPLKNTPAGIACFSVFQLDLSNYELRRRGQLVNLQQQPLCLLAYLVQRAGEVISREELQNALWPSGTYVEYELGIYSAINRLRRELGDSSARPQFIETVPKRGYRFIAHVQFERAVAEHPPDAVSTNPEAGVNPDAAYEPVTPLASTSSSNARGWLLHALAVAFVLVLIAASWLAGRYYASSHAPAERSYRYAAGLSEGEKLISLAISPAGDQIAYEAEKEGRYHLYRRYLDEDSAQSIAGTDGGRRPFYSPDGKSLGFYSEGRLNVASDSGVRQIATISPDVEQWNAIWGSDDYIYFYAGIGNLEGIWRVSPAGGPIKAILHTAPGPSGVKFPLVSQLLTGNGQRLLYSENSGPNHQSVRVLDLETGMSRELIARGAGAFWLPSGQIIFFWSNSLYALPVDKTSLKPLGSPVEVLKNVEAFQWSGAKAAISNNGTLVYAKVPDLPLREVDWLDREGRTTRVPIPAAAYEQAEVSPDGRHIAIVRKEEQSRWRLWIYDVRTTVWSPVLQADVKDIRVVWSPDSLSVIAASNRDGIDFVNLVRIRIDTPDRIERLTNEPYYSQFPQSWSAKGDTVLFLEGVHPNSGSDIMLLPLGGKSSPQPLIATPNWEKSPTFSPAGDAVAYQTGRPDNPAVKIQRYDSASHRTVGNAWEVPDSQAHEPLWSLDGKRLFYLNASNDLVWLDPEASNKGSNIWISAMPKPPQDDWWTRPYSMARDGRVLFIRGLSEAGRRPPQFQVVVNWTMEVNRLCPVR